MSNPAARRAVASVVVAVVAVALLLLGTRNAQLGGGRLGTGACVVLTDTSVRPASCAAAHDGRVVTLLSQTYQACPTGTAEYDAADSAASLCVVNGAR